MESSAPARVLIVANQTAATPTLIEAVRRRAESGPCAFMLLVPHSSHGLGKLASADATASDTHDSEAVLELALPLLEDAAGGKMDSMIGDPSPLRPSRTRSTVVASTKSSCLRSQLTSRAS